MLKKQVGVGDQCMFSDDLYGDDRFSSESEPDSEISLDSRYVELVLCSLLSSSAEHNHVNILEGT
jgi:hypothetical protein